MDETIELLYKVLAIKKCYLGLRILMLRTLRAVDRVRVLLNAMKRWSLLLDFKLLDVYQVLLILLRC